MSEYMDVARAKSAAAQHRKLAAELRAVVQVMRASKNDVGSLNYREYVDLVLMISDEQATFEDEIANRYEKLAVKFEMFDRGRSTHWSRISKDEWQLIVHLGEPNAEGRSPRYLHLTVERESPYLWRYSANLRDGADALSIEYTSGCGRLSRKEACNAAEEAGAELVKNDEE